MTIIENTLRDDELAYASLDLNKKEGTKTMQKTSVPNMIGSVSYAAKKVIELMSDDMKWGGHFVFLSAMSSVISDTRIYGSGGVADFEQAQRFEKSAREKAERLRAHPEHRSSWQSGPGGAIRCNDRTILSFDGFSGPGDEAVVLLTAVDLNLLTSGEAREIAQLSDNRIFATSQKA